MPSKPLLNDDILKRFVWAQIHDVLKALGLNNQEFNIMSIVIDPKRVSIEWFDQATMSYVTTQHILPPYVRINDEGPKSLNDKDVPWERNRND